MQLLLAQRFFREFLYVTFCPDNLSTLSASIESWDGICYVPYNATSQEAELQ